MKMSVLHGVYILTFVLVSALLWEDCSGQANPRRRQRNRNTAQRNEGLPTDLQQAYLSAVDGEQQPSTSGNARAGMRSASSDNWWQGLAPSTPAPDTVECAIEVLMTETIGGRCVRLAGARRLAVCQSGMHLDVNSQQCHNLLSVQQSVQQVNPQPQPQPQPQVEGS